MDGSASRFIYLLLDAGIEEQNAPKKFIRVKQPVRVKDGDKWAEFKYYNKGFRLDFTIDFEHPAIGKDVRHYQMDFWHKRSYNKSVAPRTFGFMKDIEYLQSRKSWQADKVWITRLYWIIIAF